MNDQVKVGVFEHVTANGEHRQSLSMPSDYLVLFAQVHDEFRIPELHSVSELYKFKIGYPPKIDTSRPFMILSLESEEHALILARRCILVK